MSSAAEVSRDKQWVPVGVHEVPPRAILLIQLRYKR